MLGNSIKNMHTIINAYLFMFLTANHQLYTKNIINQSNAPMDATTAQPKVGQTKLNLCRLTQA